MRKPLKFRQKEIEDQKVRQAFETLQDFFKGHPLAGQNWEHFEREYTEAVTKDRVRHTLGALPKDIIQTFKTGAGSVTFEYADFTREFIVITTTGAAKVRFIAGSFLREKR